MEHILMQIKKRRGVTIPKLLMMILGFKNWWELAPQHFCTPLPCRKTRAKAFLSPTVLRTEGDLQVDHLYVCGFSPLSYWMNTILLFNSPC